MKPIPFFTAALLLAGGSTALVSATTTSGPGETRALSAQADGEYESLLAEFKTAEARFKDALKTASKDERRSLRKNAPVKAFWDRFAALARGGDGLSML